ncbi:MAG: NUDIX domain-containing protein, partial [Thermoanaerobaculia bacterium]
MPADAHSRVIEAAGGILWRRSAGFAELAVIHRPRHRDWSLPKGKRDRGESWQQTALREVVEET